MIRVKDASKLDFEKVESVTMELIAREVVQGGRETRVTERVNFFKHPVIQNSGAHHCAHPGPE